VLGILLAAALIGGSPAAAQVRVNLPAAGRMVPVAPDLGLGAPALSLSLPDLALQQTPVLDLEVQTPAVAPAQTALGSLFPKEAKKAQEPLSARSSRFFDQSAIAGNRMAAPVDIGDPGSHLPMGAVDVRARTAHTPGDIASIIPEQENSKDLIHSLREIVRRSGGIDIWTYTDAYGREFHAIDIGSSRQALDLFPEFEHHEKVLVDKILRFTNDVKVLVREEGKTPDLLVNGVITELKTDGGHARPKGAMEKANRQVLSFAARHGLGEGQVAINVLEWTDPPVQEALDAAEAFRADVPANGLQNIILFGQRGALRLARGNDGRYQVAGMGFQSAADFPGRAFTERHWGWHRERARNRRADYSSTREEADAALELLAKLESVENRRSKYRRRARRGGSSETQYEIMSRLWRAFRREHGAALADAFLPVVELYMQDAYGAPSGESQGATPRQPKSKKKKKNRQRFRGGGRSHR
jgi:hypothetical protein